MNRQLRIRDLTLRDGQQSLFATRMTQAQMDKVLPLFRAAHFYAMEVWGGAVPDSVMRYLGENPWERLESVKAAIGDSSLLTALSRGRNLFGYVPYPDDVIDGFSRNAIASGIDVMRIFDALNDAENMKSSISSVKEAGGMADCAVCYTVAPKFSARERFSAFFSGRRLPGNIFDIAYFVKKSKELEALGADMITIKDMAGLLDPETSSRLISALKGEIEVPIDLHMHCTPGFGVASYLAAMVKGVDIIDTAVLSFSGGPSAPAYEIMRVFADKLGLDTGVDAGAVARIDAALREVRAELAQFDQYKLLPPVFDASSPNLSPELNRLFDDALELTVGGKLAKALELCRKIEAAFNYPPPDEIVQKAQIPGGMYTNMVAQMKEAKLERHLEEMLRAVPYVRLDSGLPPLVTPTSQIVGVQAVNYVISKAKGEDGYANISKNFAELVKGSYGKTPWKIDPEFRLKICGTREEQPYDVSGHQRHPNPALPEAGSALLAQGEKEELLLELFPSVAERFLKARRLAEWKSRSAVAGVEKEEGFGASRETEGKAPESLGPEARQYFTPPAFASDASLLPADYAVEDGLPEDFWPFALDNAR